MRVLLVEDDPQIGDGLASGLRGLGFAVDWFQSGGEADSALGGADYDAIVLDLGLPGRDGMDWMRRWRGRAETVPVLILTARDGVDSRISGLDAGADDYLIKPLAVSELAARLRAVTRRARGRPEAVWRHGSLEYRPDVRAASWRGRSVELSPREAALLEVLLAHPNRILSKATLVDKLYDWASDPDSNALEVFVHHLRRKIHPGIVRTVRGVGYALGAPDTGAPCAAAAGEDAS
jgi:two-component system response regulator QseB